MLKVLLYLDVIMEDLKNQEIIIDLSFFAESQCTLCGEPEGECVFLQVFFSKQTELNT